MKRITVKITLPSWFANLKGPPRDDVKIPKGNKDRCACASLSTAAYKTVCLSCISKNLDTIKSNHPPTKSPAADFTHRQPLSSDQTQALGIHNQAREAATQTSSVGRPGLVWDPHLADLARQWAQHLAAGKRGLQHSSREERRGQGENLYWMSAGASLSEASQAWVDESAAYHGQKIDVRTVPKYCHYTQIIWPSTTKVGIALAKNRSGATYVVARYSPEGNFLGQSAFTGN